MTLQEIDQITDPKAKRQALLDYKQELEMKKLVAEVEQMEIDSLRKHTSRENTEKQLEEARLSLQLRQANCNHRKGGLGVDGFMGKGQDANYAIHKHTYPWGDTWVNCLRCGKEWKPGDPEYAMAMALPTDNPPSGGAMWIGLDPERIKELRK